jgi:pectate lyase
MKISILFTIALSLLMVGCGGSNSDKKNTQPSSAANSSSSVTQSSDSSQSASAESSSSESSRSDSSSSAVSSSEESSSEESSSSSSMPSGAWACPASGLYFCDDFAQNNHAQWTLKAAADNSSGPNGVFDIADDNGNFILRYTAASSGGVLAVVKPEAFSGVTSADYYVEAKIRPRENSTTGNKQIYLITRYQDDNNWYAGALNVQNATTSTQVEIVKMKAGSISRPKQVKKPIEQGKAGMLDGQWYSLRIETLGDTLTVYLDGETIAAHTDNDFTEAGLIGLWTANKSFEIDDIKVGNANDKPASLLIDPAITSYNAEVGDAARLIHFTAKTDSGAADTVKVESTNPAVVSVSVNNTSATLTPVGEGSATITFTSDSGLVRSISATIAPQFVMPTASYNFTDQVSPAVGEVNAYEDATLKLTFDSAPTLGSAGSVRIFKSRDDSLVDTIALVDEKDAIGYGTLRTLNTRPIRISGNTASINLHANKLEANTGYYVAISGSVFEGATLAGQPFTGIGKNANWHFTTRAALPTDLTNLLVDDNGTSAHFRSVQGALNYAMKNIPLNDAVTITINEGVYEEPLYLRNKNNVRLLGQSRANSIIQYPNNELLNSGSAGRALFLVEAADMLSLENLTIKNTTLIGAGGQAETIYFNSPSGRLIAKDANFISEQDTLLLKGWTWFYNTLVAGNVDFIWGYSKASLFEKSEIRSLGRSTGNNNGGYVLQARVEAEGDKGFVFLNSSLTNGAGPSGEVPIAASHYLARSPGGTTTFDNIVFVNTKMDSHINAIGWAGKDINGQPQSNPGTGTATTGWREYNSMDLTGAALDMSARQFGYALSSSEVAGYCSRAAVFAAYNNGEGWNPLPEDNSDCLNIDGSEISSSSSSSESSASNSSNSSSASSEPNGGASSSDASSSSSVAVVNWSPTYGVLQSALVAEPAAGSNSNFNATAAPILFGDFKFYSASSGSLRLHMGNDGSYAINYNGTSLKNDAQDSPVSFVEGAVQVDPTLLNAVGGVTRFVSVPYSPVATPVTLTVTYSNGSATAAGACENGQIAIVDQSGKTWKVASSCSNPERSTITATVTDPTVSELFILMSRNGDGGGGIRIWNIELTK